MKILLILAVAIASVLILLRMRASDTGKTKKPTPKTRAKRVKAQADPAQQPYRATSILVGPNACEAARAAAQQPYLDSTRETPVLPLPDCTEARCSCKYVHKPDRRDDEGDRRFGSSLQASMYASGEVENQRTNKSGRRHDD